MKDIVACKDAFHQAMIASCFQTKAEVKGYDPKVFRVMVERDKGWIAAKRVINASTDPYGYTRLFEEDRLDLTVEAIVVENERWHDLFTDQELRRALRRLDRYRYPAKVPSTSRLAGLT